MNTNRTLTMATALLCVCTLLSSAKAQTPAARDYRADQLIVPCRLADSDAREEGTRAQIECEQYMLGFVDALAQTGASGPGKSTCPPVVNTGPEVRWAFMRWVYGDFTARRKMSAPDALMETLKASFPCK